MSLPYQTNKSLFLAALEIDSEAEREQFLQQTCGDNQDLLAEIQSMLFAHDHPPQLLAKMDQVELTVDQVVN